ncbi:MAG: hypothetical protein KC468_19815 [Myxococcales bacterium]|nr:hypothetical protein [Myxococcales bacterium]
MGDDEIGMSDEEAIIALIGDDLDDDDWFDGDEIGGDEIDWVGDDSYDPTSMLEAASEIGAGKVKNPVAFIKKMTAMAKARALRARKKQALMRRRRKAALRRRAMKRILARRRAVAQGKGRVGVKRRMGRVLMIGGTVTAAAAGSFDATTTVQELCRVDRIFTSATDAGGSPIDPNTYQITDIKVGTRSQLAALPALPATLFQADATAQGAGLKLDTVQPGTDFTLRFNVPSAGTYRFGCYASALR